MDVNENLEKRARGGWNCKKFLGIMKMKNTLKH